MLSSIAIENFKGFGIQRQVIKLAPITLLFGANSAGKSSFFHAVFYLRQVFETSIAIPGELNYFSPNIHLGGYRQIIHNHNDSDTIKFVLDFSFDENENNQAIYIAPILGNRRDARTEYYFGCEKLSIELVIASISSQPGYVKNYSVFWDDNKLVEIECNRNLERGYWDLDVRFNYGNLELAQIEIPEDTTSDWKTIYRYPGAIPRAEDPILSMCCKRNERALNSDEEEFANKIDLLLLASAQLAKNYLNDVLYIGPVRSVPQDDLSPRILPPTYRWSSGLAAWDLLQFLDQQEIDSLNAWLGCDFLNTGVEIVRVALLPINIPINSSAPSIAYRIMFRPTNDDAVDPGPLLRIQDVGFGVSQLIPVLVALLAARQSSVMVEQPEIHLHPRLQTEMGDLMIDACLNGQNKKQAIFETHSEHLILRILRRIRETADNELPDLRFSIQTDDIAVNYFDRVNSTTVVKHLRVNREGEFIDTWPHGFFDERIGELYG